MPGAGDSVLRALRYPRRHHWARDFHQRRRVSRSEPGSDSGAVVTDAVSDAHRQRGQGPVEGAGPPLQLIGRKRQFEVGEAVEELLDRDGIDELGRVLREAGVRARAPRQPPGDEGPRS
ncbi:hypothetical protein GCM10010390_06380 [Streptomyces mordarskii]|uniref:Uncharacterized protein n=1 Tax=Streptomyces mordarskii TaxID=1226758 RepID=A0ABN1BVF3_9ACTN